MIRNILYSICLHLIFLIAIYFGVKNTQYYNEDPLLKGISIGLKEEVKKIKGPEKKVEPQAPQKKTNKKKEVKSFKKKRIAKKAPKKAIKQDIILPTEKDRPPAPRPKKLNKEVNKAPSETPLTIKKIYQNDVFTDDIDNLDLSSVYTRSIKSHLNFCFSSMLDNQDPSLEMVEEIEIVFNITKKGVIKFNLKQNSDDKLLKNKKFANYIKIIDKINNSTQNCAILRNLPTDKYEIWKEFKVLFTSNSKDQLQ